jgi:hypothetical protein
MVISGKFRTRAELRKKPRRQFHYTASIVADAQGQLRACAISDISERGARLVLENDDKLPDRFVLLLTAKGDTRRSCRVVWRTGTTLGVEFAAVQS